ncbi:pirin family protein [Shewanella violacea]|uniref:Pirin-related protein n=1 Tax=Shewanella violacea (strain JCM 10179 / CIP 106290 / LMG 19151 / DSS12) TaxID=637905 RepID=D4ZFS1_SHEVD|nr:pirin family protein [Shewanella violacea]BAJ00520.1 pirin-related protein [Shewanella violacea DSS12]
MEILTKSDLREGGFAGLKEHQFVMDKKAFGPNRNPQAWDGLGNFVYLADARFMPKGETRMHGHKEVDVISVMVRGRINHEGSLEHGQMMNAKQAQVQRAGGEGFSHNEVNPDSEENQMIQLWVLPDRQGEKAGYKLYSPKIGELTRIYGGEIEQDQTFDSHTLISVANLETGHSVEQATASLVYVSDGEVEIDGARIEAGTLVRSHGFTLVALTCAQVIVIHES